MKRSSRATLFVGTICGLIFLFSAMEALAQESAQLAPAAATVPTTSLAPPPRPVSGQSSLLLRWIDARGNIFSGSRVIRMAWVWSKLAESDPIESPALRLWITSRLPQDWIPKKVSGDGITLAEPFKEGETQTLAVDLRTTKATMRFEFVDKNNHPAEMTLAVQVSVAKPYVIVRPECAKLDLKFQVQKVHSQHLYVGLSCIDLGDSFDIFFFRSKDSTWYHGDGLVRFDPENRFSAFRYHVAKPKSQTVYSQKLFRVGTNDEFRQAGEYAVFYYPKVKPKIFYMNAGLGITSYSYDETYLGLKLTQISSTGKMSFGVRLIPKVLDFAFNGFMTLLAFTHSPNDRPEARFYGLNGRIGYRLPLDLGAVEFMFLTGWYFWGMMVNGPVDTAYGIKALSGPQLFVTMINSQSGRAGWWTYLKYAMISDRLKLTNAGNRELAVGAGIELSARETKPFAITLDIAHAQFEMDDKSNGMHLLSITGGIQKTF